MLTRETSALKQVWIFDYYEQKSLTGNLWHLVSVETSILPDQRSQKLCPRSISRFKDSEDKRSQK